MIKVAFFKGKGDWTDKLVRLLSRSRYSHCEVVIDSKWYSSFAPDGGLRVTESKRGSLEDWDYLVIPDKDNSIRNKTIEVYLSNRNARYSYLGAFFGGLLKLPIKRKNTLFCSEFVAMCFSFKHPYRYTPQNVYDKLKDIYFS